MKQLQSDNRPPLRPVDTQCDDLVKNSPLPAEIEALSRAVYRINFIFSKFNQLDDDSIEEWAKMIKMAIPEITEKIMRHLVNNMMMGGFDFNPNIGIRNIFLAYKCFASKSILIYDKKAHESGQNNISVLKHSSLGSYIRLKQQDKDRYFIYKGAYYDKIDPDKVIDMIWPTETQQSDLMTW